MIFSTIILSLIVSVIILLSVFYIYNLVTDNNKLKKFRKHLFIGQTVFILQDDIYINVQIVSLYENSARVLLGSGKTIGILINSIYPIS